MKTILTAFQSILSQSDSSYEDCQTVLVELLVAMMSQRITAEELALLIDLNASVIMYFTYRDITPCGL